MKTFSPEVICCGHAAYDLNFMMDEFPVEDRKYKIDELVQTGGGPASNAASLLAAWGAKTAYAGLVGDDVYGRLIMEELKKTGVDTSLVQLDGSKNTPLSAVIVNRANGSRTLLNRRDESDQPAVTDEIIEALESMKNKEGGPGVLHFDGHALDLSLKMIEVFPQAKVVVDAGSYRDSTDCLCAEADYAICSRRFAEVCTGLDDVVSDYGRQSCIKLLTKRYPGRVIVTLGEKGLFFGLHACKNDNSGSVRTVSMPAFCVDSIDSTGAGDIFHASFSFGLLKGLDFEDNLRLAAAAAALSTTKAGARTSIPGLKKSLDLAGNLPEIL